MHVVLRRIEEVAGGPQRSASRQAAEPVGVRVFGCQRIKSVIDGIEIIRSDNPLVGNRFTVGNVVIQQDTVGAGDRPTVRGKNRRSLIVDIGKRDVVPDGSTVPGRQAEVK